MTPPKDEVGNAGRVLIIDDDEGHAEALADGLELDGYVCTLAHSGEEGIAKMGDATYDAVLTDLVMHDRDGLEVLAEAGALQPEAAVLLITGHGSVETAVDAMRRGAVDYIEKPVRINELRTRLERAIENRRLRREHRELRQQVDRQFRLEGIVGHSPAMQRVFDVIQQVSATNATVLILGESGTGKELVARAIHRGSPRSERRFVAMNCAALSEGLIESELFGHVKGSFTGAVTHNEGRMVYADGGTLFLDEVGDMPLDTQAKLLRVLETREVQPVGGNTTKKVDIRLLAATNHDLRDLVSKGKFREDLLYRLQVVTVDLPPLRERVGDVPLLLDHYVHELSAQHGREVRGITPEARAVLVRYAWPGNVRELRNVVENMVLLTRSDVIGIDDVPEQLLDGPRVEGGGGGGYDLTGRSLQEVERDLIAANLSLVEGNRQKAAQMLGIGERTLYRKLKEYGLS
ncbi:sigma-54-dependent transcriptional regulator [Engelhardtia mirabilis]|uniref:DNA-binding transcriptional response regulator n=1 Tax=Engelhardtia mirabilis TaxID=2528011 RepID=A0A518BJN9_9BACT|nr:DNA-binding transcriptional response regulator [Planctomycetes bacterium Pla133]QDV01527.1 DNA-binding transcriptional response regulator [Planctomycetes bacterium Pla86]